MAPRLRDDLVAATVEEGGVPYVDLTDPATGVNFRFYDFEYDLAKQLTGQPLEEVVAWASATYQLELTSEALDQFIEKLAGLGFLAGAGAGAQPQALSPPSPSSSSGPFGKLTPSVLTAGAEEPIELAASPMFGDGSGGVRAPVEAEVELSASALLEEGSSAPHPAPPLPPAEAAAPDKLTEGHPTEFRLKEAAGDELQDQASQDVKDEVRSDAASDARGGSFAKPRTLHGINLAPLTPMTPLAPPPEGAPPLPRLQAVAPPLPTLTSEAVAGGARRTSAFEARPAEPAPAEAQAHATAASDESPLASIAQAIAADVTAPNRATPAGSLEAPEPQPQNGVVAAGDVSPNSASWAAALTEEVSKPTDAPPSGERRQPPAPEVVVMPPVAEPAAPLPRRKAPIVVGVLLAGGVVAAVVLALHPLGSGPPAAAHAAAVHVVAPQPTTFYEWFAPSGTVVAGKEDELGFPVAGKVQDVMPPGTTFSAGEPVARLQGVAARELNVNRVRARIAFFEQLRDSSRAAGNEAAARQAEANLAARTREMAEAQASLAEMEIRPKEAGQIGQVLVERGALVKAGTPVIRIRPTGPRAKFALPPEARAKARALGFCRLETVPGTGAADGAATEKTARAIDCAFPALPDGAKPEPDAALTVDVVGAPALAAGTAVNLASARFDGVFPIPSTAVVNDGAVGAAGGAGTGGDAVWILSATGDTAERRPVEVAATVDALALVSHGLAPGDAVIVDPPPGLKAGAAITVAR